MHKSWSHLVTVSIENMIDCKYIIKNILNLFCAIAIEQTNSWYNSANSSSVKKFISFYLTEQGRRKVWNSGGLVVLGGDNVSPLVEIGLTDLPNIGGGLKPPQPPPCDGPAEYIYLKVKQNVIKIAAVTKIDLFDCNVSTVCFLMGINYIIHFLLSLQVSVLSCCTKVITIESTVWDLGFYFCFFKSGNVLF